MFFKKESPFEHPLVPGTWLISYPATRHECRVDWCDMYKNYRLCLFWCKGLPPEAAAVPASYASDFGLLAARCESSPISFCCDNLSFYSPWYVASGQAWIFDDQSSSYGFYFHYFTPPAVCCQYLQGIFCILKMSNDVSASLTTRKLNFVVLMLSKKQNTTSTGS